MMRNPVLVALLASGTLLPWAHAYTALAAPAPSPGLRPPPSVRGAVGLRTPRSWGLVAARMAKRGDKPPPPKDSEFNDGRAPFEQARKAKADEIPYGPQYWEGLEQKMGADWTRQGPDEGEVSGLDEVIDESELPAPRWYIVQCNPGLEDSVKATIQAKMENSLRLRTTIKEVLVPCTMVTKAGIGGKVVQKQEKLLGGYVLIKMCMDKDTWYIIKNSNHVLNFVGHDRARRNASGGIAAGRGHVVPTPLSRAEEKRIFDRISEMSPGASLSNFQVGSRVVVVQGVYTGNEGKVVSINPSMNRLQVRLPLFNSEKPNEFIPEQLEVLGAEQEQVYENPIDDAVEEGWV
jgi:transcriptional antiterminator NusG